MKINLKINLFGLIFFLLYICTLNKYDEIKRGFK